ncbi:hypothetical protein GE09DRAFT_955938 [Coniochaeta sp. 2T2.1]|nr:hypothetical protein GE09DRAFT_955938 [Coniochaeta sp. 2T2.1]
MAVQVLVIRTALRRQLQAFRQRLPLRQSRQQSSSKHKTPGPADSQIPVANNVPTLPFWQRLGPLTRAAEAYARAQRARPYTTQVCSSLVIYLAADMSAQSISGTDYAPERTVRSLIIGAISSIPSYKWFVFLSQNFNYSSRLLSLGTKVVVNQICFTPLFNSYFFGMQAALAGDTLGEVWKRIRRTVPVSFMNSMKLWPAVTAFSFTFIPMEYRSIFAGVIAVGWQTYLSFLNRVAEKEEAGLHLVSKQQISPIFRSHQQLIAALRARHSLITTFRPLTSSATPTLRPRLHTRMPQRQASTTTTRPIDPSPLVARLRLLAASTALLLTGGVAYLYATDTRASVHQWLVPPLLRLLYPDAEDAHHIGTKALQTLYTLGLHQRDRTESSSYTSTTNPLGITVFDTPLPNPIGISAGLDKNADIPDALFALGPAVVEIGGVTPRPQEGNPRPRVFRVPAVRALVNRYGLNSLGADAVAARLRDRLRRFARAAGVDEADLLDGLVADKTTGRTVNPGALAPGKLLAVQMAKNKNTDEKDVEAVVADYVYCVQRLAKYADVLVVNVSSPNTPGLRDLQAVEPLSRLLGAVVEEARKTERRVKPRVMVKVSPDEDDESQIEGVVQAISLSGVDGVIVGNTTKRRAGLVPAGVKLTGREQRALLEDGGFSGPVTFDRTLELVGRYRKMLDSVAGDQHKVIFASGGITNGQQALKVLNAGASLAMLYTGMVYGGSGTVTRIKREMKKELGS